MPTTGPGTAHRHKTKTGYWYDRTDLESGDTHEHPFEETPHPADTLTAAEVTALRALLAVVPEPPPPPPPPPSTEPPAQTPVSVGSPASLLDALSDNTVTAIKGSGTWQVSGATAQKADSLWLGKRFAGRTQPCVMDLTGVTLDGRGAGYFVGLAFEEGVHDLSIIGFPRIGNGNPTSTGAVVFGGYSGPEPARIRLDVELLNTLWATSGPGVSHDHGVYMSAYSGPGHELNIRANLLTQAAGKEPLDSIFHVYHGPGPRDSLVRIQGKGTDQAVIVWESSAQNLVVEGSIEQARIAVRYEAGSGLVLRDFRTTGSRDRGFYSGAGKVATLVGTRYDGKEFVAP